MATLSSLNSYSSSDTDCTVQTLTITEKEGATVQLPLMAWNPIHDLGNSMAGNGIQITHTISAPVFTLSDGTNLTQAEYNTWANIHLPTLSWSYGNVAGSNSVVKYKSYSMYFENDSQYYAGTNGLIGLSSYTIDGWFRPSNQSGPGWSTITRVPTLFDQDGSIRLRYLKNSTSNLTYHPMEDLWIQVGGDPGPYNYYRIPLKDLGISIYQQWTHIALARYMYGFSPPDGSMVLFINGQRVRIDDYGTSWFQFWGRNAYPEPTPVASNVVITNNSYHTANVQVNGSNQSVTQLGPFTYIDQLRVSNVARYNVNGFTTPTTSMTYDNNTMILLEWDQTANAVSQNAAANWPYLNSNPIVFPDITMPNVNNNPNVVLTQQSANTWTISGIHTPEDYLAADSFFNFPRDYYGNLGNANVNGTGSWTTNIRNTTVTDYDFTFPVTLSLQNTREITNTALANVSYDYNNGLGNLWGLTTYFSGDQLTYIDDNENPDSDIYTVSITTGHHASQIILSSNTSPAANVTSSWNYVSTANTNGKLTVVGTRPQVNSYLENLYLTKYQRTSQETWLHPTQRTLTRGGLYTIGGIGSPWPPNSPTAYTEISTASPYSNSQGRRSIRFTNDGEYSMGVNDTSFKSYQQGYLFGKSFPANSDYGPGSISYNNSTWSNVNSSFRTYEFWFNTESSRNTKINSWVFGLFNNNIWVVNEHSPLPNSFGQTTSTSSYPKRIVNSTTIVPGEWYHVALVRYYNGELHLFVNGVESSTYYNSGMTTTTASGFAGWSVFELGYWGGLAGIYGVGSTVWKPAHYSGYVTDIRISTIPRYTADFTPPLEPLINDYDTSFLGNFLNGTVVDDYALPTFATGTKQFNWTFTNPDNITIASLSQNYMPDEPV